MRYSKRFIKRKRVKTYRRRRVKSCKRNRSYRRRHVMKGGWGGTPTSVPIIKKLFDIDDDDETEAPMYGGWGELLT